ncbi:MAG: hypothetical protein WB777_14120 [Mycobacterium sp.]
MKTPRPMERRIAEAIRIEGDCWIWTKSLSRYGYGRISMGNLSRLAHRMTYEFLVGPIPDGLPLDHQCHNRDTTCPGGLKCRHRRCVNPAHLEPVTQAVNLARSVHANTKKTHCMRGHEFNKKNTYLRPRGGRACRVCLRDRLRDLKQAA